MLGVLFLAFGVFLLLLWFVCHYSYRPVWSLVLLGRMRAGQRECHGKWKWYYSRRDSNEAVVTGQAPGERISIYPY